MIETDRLGSPVIERVERTSVSPNRAEKPSRPTCLWRLLQCELALEGVVLRQVEICTSVQAKLYGFNRAR